MNQTNGPEQTPWLFSRAGVLVMLFFVTGALGLPLLYKSPAFSRTQKHLLALGVIIYTLALIAILVLAMMYLWKMVSQLTA